ncbi:MAG: C40 family peptidase, partial [Chloroflexia bacterium]
LTQEAAPAQPAAQTKPAAQPKIEVKPAAQPATPKAQPATQQASDPRSGTSRGASPPVAVRSSSLANTIVGTAMRYVGYRYRFGGASPSGFDCSGFVKYVVNKSGFGLSRDMGSMIASGTRVSSNSLQPGDLLFFSNTYKRGLSHVGIYLGNGKFVHAENESTGVTVSALWSAYWVSHYTTAVRLR